MGRIYDPVSGKFVDSASQLQAQQPSAQPSSSGGRIYDVNSHQFVQSSPSEVDSESETVSQQPKSNLSAFDRVLGGAELLVTPVIDLGAEVVSGLAGATVTAGAKLAQAVGLTDRDATAIGTETIRAIQDSLKTNPSANAQQVMADVANSDVVKAVVSDTKALQPDVEEYFGAIGQAIAGDEGGRYGKDLGRNMFTSSETRRRKAGQFIDQLSEDGNPVLAALAEGGIEASQTLLELATGSKVGQAVAEGVEQGTKATARAAESVADSFTDRAAERAVIESAPTVEALKQVRNDLYESTKQTAPPLSQRAVGALANMARRNLGEEALDDTIAPKTSRLYGKLAEKSGQSKTNIIEIENIRKAAGEVAREGGADGAAATKLINSIDQFYDKSRAQLGSDFKAARGVALQGMKADEVARALEKVEERAETTSFEKALATRVGQILDNDKRRRKYSGEEIEVMRDLRKGGKSKMLRLLSQFDVVDEGRVRFMGAMLAGGGAAVNPMAAIALPIVGKIASMARDRVTQNNANLLSALPRAGGDAKEIAKAYIQNTPKAKRNAEELTGLFLDPNVKAADLKKVKSTNPVIKQAADTAEIIKEKIKPAVGTGAFLDREEEPEAGNRRRVELQFGSEVEGQ